MAARHRSQFLKKCEIENLDPVKELRRMGAEIVLVREFLQLGVTAHQDYLRQCSRKKTKHISVADRREESLRRELEDFSPERAAHYAKFGDSMTRAYKQLEQSLFDKWVVNGNLMLGDATKQQLISAAIREEAIADGHQKNARFYRALAAKVSDGVQLRNCVNYIEADAIRMEVFGKSEGMAA